MMSTYLLRGCLSTLWEILDAGRWSRVSGVQGSGFRVSGFRVLGFGV